MAHIPIQRRRAPLVDAELRVIGMVAVAVVLVAALAGVIWSCGVNGCTGVSRSGGEAIGATLASAGHDRLVVDSIRGDGAAGLAGLRVGDLVETVNGVAVPTIGAADYALRGRRVDIRIRRGMRVIDLHLGATGMIPLGQQDPADRG